MNGQDLLKAMGEIRDDYILEAAPNEKEIEVSKAISGDPGEDGGSASGKIPSDPTSRNPKIISWSAYRRTLGVLAAGLVLVISIGVIQNLNRGRKAEESMELMEAAGGSESGQNTDLAEEVQTEKDGEGMNNSESVQYEAAQSAVRNDTDLEMAEEDVAEEAAEDAADAMFAAEVQDADTVQPLANLKNPWISCGSLSEAEQTAGFSLTVPEADDGWPYQEIYAVQDSLIEVRYVDGDGIEGFRIRKGIDTESAAGDDLRYSTITTADIGGQQVTLKGDGTQILLARWEAEAYTYTVTAEERVFTEEEIKALVQKIQ